MAGPATSILCSGGWMRPALVRVPVALSLVGLLTAIPLRIVAQSPSRGVAHSARDLSTDGDWRESARDANYSPEFSKGKSSSGLDAGQTGDQNPTSGRRRARSAEGGSIDSPRFGSPSYANAGQLWREYNLAPYTNRLSAVAHPEQAVVDWVMRQTGWETWHGEEIAVLSATRGRLRVFHCPEIQHQVAEIVERFTRPAQGQVSIRVQFATTTDLNWRTNLAHLLKPVAYGDDGQQAWLIAPEDAALIRNRVQTDRAAGPLSQQITAKNGQETGVESGRTVTYISGLDLSGGTYVSYQPVMGRLQEGVRLTFAPLWTNDGSAVDVVVKLTTRVVQKLHYVRAAAPLSSGNQETVMQVPESAGTEFEQTLHWPTSQILLISAGMQSSNPSSRRSSFSFAPTAVELLIIAELSAPYSARPTPREPVAEQ